MGWPEIHEQHLVFVLVDDLEQVRLEGDQLPFIQFRYEDRILGVVSVSQAAGKHLFSPPVISDIVRY